MKQLILIFCILLPLFSIGQKTETYDVSCICEINQIIEKGQPIQYEMIDGLHFDGNRDYTLQIPYTFNVYGRSIRFSDWTGENFTFGFSQLTICGEKPNSMIELLTYFKSCLSRGNEPPDLCDDVVDLCEGVECEPCTACNPETGLCESICKDGEVCNVNGVCVPDDPCPDCPILNTSNVIYSDGQLCLPDWGYGFDLTYNGLAFSTNGSCLNIVLEGNACITPTKDNCPECSTYCISFSECVEGSTVDVSDCVGGSYNQLITTTELNGEKCETSTATNVLPCSPNPCESTCITLFGADNNIVKNGSENPLTVSNPLLLSGIFINTSYAYDVVIVSECSDECIVGTTTVGATNGAFSNQVAAFLGGEFSGNDYGLFTHFANAWYVPTPCGTCEFKVELRTEIGTVFVDFEGKDVQVCTSDARELTDIEKLECASSECCPEFKVTIGRNQSEFELPKVPGSYCSESVNVTCSDETPTSVIIDDVEYALIPQFLEGEHEITLISECGKEEKITLIFPCCKQCQLSECSDIIDLCEEIKSDHTADGNGAYTNEILWFTHAANGDGIDVGDVSQITLPNGDVATLTVTNTIDNNGGGTNASDYTLEDIPAWWGSAINGYYNLADAVYYSSDGNHITVEYSVIVKSPNGCTYEPNIVVVDGEAMLSSERLIFTTNGGAWTVLENVNGSSYGNTGIGTNTAEIWSTFPATNGTPILLSTSVSNFSIEVLETGINNGGYAVGIFIGCNVPLDPKSGKRDFSILSFEDDGAPVLDCGKIEFPTLIDLSCLNRADKFFENIEELASYLRELGWVSSEGCTFTNKESGKDCSLKIQE